MRRPSSLLSWATGLVVMVATALGPASASAADSPEGAANAVLDAFVAKQWDRLPPLVCEAKRDDVVGQLDLSLAFGGEGLDPAPLLAGLTIAIDGRKVTLVAEDGDRATVDIQGTQRITVEEAAAREWVRQTLAQIGQATDEAAVEEYLGYFLDSFQEPVDLATTADVVRQDGQWLLCDDLVEYVPDETLDPLASIAPAVDPLCDTMTVEELNAASGLAFVSSSPLDGGCSWDSDLESEDYFNVSIYREDGELQFIKDVWTDGKDVTIAGKPAWVTDFGTWVQLEGGLLTIMPYLTGPSAEAITAIDLASRVGEIVVPRIP